MTPENDNRNSHQMQPLVAARALRRLLNDPERTEDVFVIIRAMSGNSIQRGYKRFAQLPAGQRILGESRELLDTLRDRETLGKAAADSLAAAYLAFTGRENLSADGLVAASSSDAQDLHAGVEFYGRRLRDQHDLWHTLTDYGRDELGEACLLAFTYAQTRNRGVGIIAAIGGLKLSKAYGRGVFAALWRAYRDGRRAAWLPGQEWETLLVEPIEQVRRELRLRSPQRYTELRQATELVAVA